MSELVTSRFVNDIAQIDTPIHYNRQALENGLAFLDMPNEDREDTALLFGTFAQNNPETLGQVDPRNNVIVLYAGAITRQSDRIVANQNSDWTALAAKDKLSTAFNIVTAEKAAELVTQSITQMQRDEIRKPRRHNDEMLVATGFMTALGVSALYEWIAEASGYNGYEQMALGALGAVAVVAGTVGIQTNKNNSRELQKSLQDTRDRRLARRFSESLVAARLFGANKVIEVERLEDAKVIELRPGISTRRPPAAS